MGRIFITIAVLVVLVLFFFARSKPVGHPQKMAEPVAIEAGAPTEIPPTPAPQAEVHEQPQGQPQTDENLAIFTSEAFRKTEVARRWQAQGVTEPAIAAAIQTLRDRGFSGASLRDPALISQFLPAQNVRPVMVESIELPATAAAGQPVPFSVSARFPSPAYQFESWSIQTEGSTVTVRPVGTRSADPVASVVVPVTLEGALPGLDAGTYNVRFEAIGDPVERSLSVQSR